MAFPNSGEFGYTGGGSVVTEAEWLASTESPKMLGSLPPTVSERKKRLYSISCCMRLTNILTNKARLHLSLAELFADGKITEEELLSGAFTERRVKTQHRRHAIWAVQAAGATNYDGSLHAAVHAMSAAIGANEPRASENVAALEKAEQSKLLRDIFGNPFRPVVLDPSWLTSNVLDLARTIYDERAFERLAILADALMDAGCNNDEILNHCRSVGPHVRGCWVVDLVLNKQ